MPNEVPENGIYTDQSYNGVKSLSKPKPETDSQNQGTSQAQELRETSASKVRQPAERRVNTRGPAHKSQTGGTRPRNEAGRHNHGIHREDGGKEDNEAARWDECKTAASTRHRNEQENARTGKLPR